MNVVAQTTTRTVTARVFEAAFAVITGNIGSDVSVRMFAFVNMLVGAIVMNIALTLAPGRKFGIVTIPAGYPGLSV